MADTNMDADTKPMFDKTEAQAKSEGARPTTEPPTPDRFEPGKTRVVDVEDKETGDVLRRDCYDPDGGAAEMGDVMRVKDGELYLRAIDWARSQSCSEEPKLRWEPTGLTREEVGRIGVFTWPLGEPVRVFVDRKANPQTN